MGIHHLVRAGVGAGMCGALVASLSLTGAGAGSATGSTPGASGVPGAPGLRQKAGPTPERVDGGARARICRACGIRVANVKVSPNRRMVSADVKWARSLITRKGKGHRQRFNVRLVVLYGAQDKRTGVLTEVSKKHVSSVKEHVRMRLSKRKARLLLKAPDAVLSVSHNYDRPRDGDKLFERNYVTTTHLTKKHFRFRNTPERTTTAESAPEIPAISASGNRATSRELRDCSDIPIRRKADLSGCDLTGAKLAGADLFMANLTGAKLASANLTGANLYFAVLTDANLTDANLTDAFAPGAGLYYANLTRADLGNADLTSSILEQADLTGADVSDADLLGANLIRANLTRANLWDANLTEAILTEAILTRANLGRANLTGANLTRANLRGAKLTGAKLIRANLTGADVVGIQDFNYAACGGTTLPNGNVTSSSPSQCPRLT
ncbi:MAG: pentapeptide repeat-containing protein [Candidatus Nanopelagicales bacterium]|nr:pentapeptide repeat-containing protein [Candidatus Nanopelagicales bacterium]